MERLTIQVGGFEVNCSILSENGKAWIVDPGQEPGRIIDLLAKKGLEPAAILLTHGHFDHIGGVEEVRKATGAEVYIHTDDSFMLESKEYSLHRGLIPDPFIPVTDYTAVFGDCWINDGDLSFRVIHTPGHSRGSVCYLCGDTLFSGDTIFRCSIGRTDFESSDPIAMSGSLKLINDLEGELNIYPGHGESTTLSYEKKYNPYLLRAKR